MGVRMSDGANAGVSRQKRETSVLLFPCYNPKLFPLSRLALGLKFL